MLQPKTQEEIELIRESAMLVSRTHAEVARHIMPGTSLLALDKIAHDFIVDHGGRPAFLNYRGSYPFTLCTSVNNIVVHGFPSTYQLKDGDILSVDCGIELNGYFGDSAYTYTIGEIDPDVQLLLKVTQECLQLGMAQAKPGNRVGDISSAIQIHAEAHGFGVVRELCGHGVGKKLHERPDVPNFGKRGHGPKLIEGVTLAIEPMITLGSRNITSLNEWEISTADKKPSAHFEHTIVVRKGGGEALSSFAPIEESLNNQPQLEPHGETVLH